ncbi:MAG: sporulation protein YtfJ [Oscillospiraceae bacterium]|nr:sporulation protein YtfJ [Oscillospiraceae bacterium]
MAENKQHPLENIMSTTIQNIRDMVDVNTIIGQPIQVDNVTILPISKVSFGFASGGSDFTGKYQKTDANPFGGGGGAGVDISPIGFLIIKEDSVRLLPVVPPNSAVSRAVEMLPDLVDKVTDFIEKQKAKKEDDF